MPVKSRVPDADAALDARVAGGTAVTHVAAAHRIRGRAAAPGRGGRPAAGLAVVALGRGVALHVPVL